MHILVENSSRDHFRNVGDLAMLDVAMRRMREFWPDATLHIVGREDAAFLDGAATKRVDPNVLLDKPRAVNRVLPIKRAWLPTGGREELAGLERRLVRSARRVSAAIARTWQRNGDATETARVQLIRRVDALVVSGGGFLTDVFAHSAHAVLDNIALAVQYKKPVFLFGQGIGPVADDGLLRKMKAALSHVQLIGMREGVVGPKLLRELGLSENRLQVTGDDAVEVAYARRAPQLGTGLGVNLRVAYYSGLDRQAAVALGARLRHFGAARGMSYYGIPIDGRQGSDGDPQSISTVLAGAEADIRWPRSLAIEDVVSHVGGCRVVVTGSYHAGVFALSQGIPVVAIARTRYYRHKFAGLAGMFGTGCRVLDADEPGMHEQLEAAVDEAWTTADAVRDRLLDAARRQVALSRRAWSELGRRFAAQGSLRMVNEPGASSRAN